MTLLLQVLTRESICFIGCGLKEPQLKKPFELYQRHQSDLRKHPQYSSAPVPPKYIIAHKDGADISSSTGSPLVSERHKQDNQFYESLGLTQIWYVSPNGDHYELQEALE